ncbi:MAG: winged helix-turn-helix transcriptional regulator [Clostridiaceae bacterium]|nr:winged helix-turn-helix transcriptional regulator [Clostridiaceae bacterium]
MCDATDQNLADESQFIHPNIVATVQKESPSPELLSDLADLYKIFGDSTRVQILSALRVHEMCVGDLAGLLNMTLSAVSHQLRALRANKLVKSRRDGKIIFYSLADAHVEAILDMGLEHLQEINCPPHDPHCFEE